MTCVETAPARAAAFALMKRQLSPPVASAATVPEKDARAAGMPPKGDYYEIEGILDAASDVHKQCDTQHGRVFVFLATMGTTLPGGNPGLSGLPAEWCRLLNVPEKRTETKWSWYKECVAMAVTVPAFALVARAAAQPVKGQTLILGPS